MNLTSNASLAVVGCSVELAYSIKGSLPLNVSIEYNMTTLDLDPITTLPKNGEDVFRNVSLFKILEAGPNNFTCVVANSTEDRASSTVQVTGISKLNFCAKNLCILQVAMEIF